MYEFILFFFKIVSAKLVQETLSAKGQNLKIRLVTITIDTNAFLKFEDGCEWKQWFQLLKVLERHEIGVKALK